MGEERTKRRLSIALRAIARISIFGAILGGALAACTPDGPRTAATSISRPPPDDPTPTGITYICEGRKQVNVVYARNRASVTLDGKTWRLEYQPTADGFRYFDALHEWAGRDELAAFRLNGQRVPLAFNCRPTART
jgi:membrane-bound inhibitor of C-type lysozyme